MPQLIAMVIVVVGAMIYMFQTFGGTGDKIEGIAQKTSIITEINNIKNGLQLASKADHIIETEIAADPDAVNDLQGLAELAYFAEQMNTQLTDAVAADANKYKAISFGEDNSMVISLVAKQNAKPGIFVDLSGGSLSTNAAFLEAQISNDLSSIATIARKANTVADDVFAAAGDNPDTVAVETTYVAPDATKGAGTDTDGKFTIFFRDFGSSDLVK